MSKRTSLCDVIAKRAIMLPGVPNAAMARQAERAGFDAVYVSGAGMANATAGVPDIGLLTLTEVAQLAGYVASAVDIPAIVEIGRASCRERGDTSLEKVSVKQKKDYGETQQTPT